MMSRDRAYDTIKEAMSLVADSYPEENAPLQEFKFLETITLLGNSALVPINRIKFINFKRENNYEVVITSDDGSWVECYVDEKEATSRYNQVKELIKAG